MKTIEIPEDVFANEEDLHRQFATVTQPPFAFGSGGGWLLTLE